MARLFTCNFSGGALAAEGAELGGLTTPNAPGAYSTAQKRGAGIASYLLSGGAGGEYAQYLYLSQAITYSGSTVLYMRACVYIVSIGSDAEFQLVNMDDRSVGGLQLVLDNSGLLVQNWSNNTTIATYARPSLNTWHVVEVSYAPSTGAYTLRVDGIVQGSGTAEKPTSTTNVYYEFCGNPAAACQVYVTDLALNDQTGTSQNSWCGLGYTTLLRTSADSSRAGFTTGAGGTTNLFLCVNHLPPVGVAAASATSTSQIIDATASTTDQYTATMQTALNAGVPLSSSIVLAQARAVHGSSTTTVMTNGIAGASNPVITEATTGTSSTAAGTYPTGWVMFATGYAYSPTMVLGTAPTLKFRKGTSTTDTSMCCHVGLLVEYVPQNSRILGAAGARQAVMRAMTR